MSCMKCHQHTEISTKLIGPWVTAHVSLTTSISSSCLLKGWASGFKPDAGISSAGSPFRLPSCRPGVSGRRMTSSGLKIGAKQERVEVLEVVDWRFGVPTATASSETMGILPSGVPMRRYVSMVLNTRNLRNEKIYKNTDCPLSNLFLSSISLAVASLESLPRPQILSRCRKL